MIIDCLMIMALCQPKFAPPFRNRFFWHYTLCVGLQQCPVRSLKNNLACIEHDLTRLCSPAFPNHPEQPLRSPYRQCRGHRQSDRNIIKLGPAHKICEVILLPACLIVLSASTPVSAMYVGISLLHLHHHPEIACISPGFLAAQQVSSPNPRTAPRPC